MFFQHSFNVSGEKLNPGANAKLKSQVVLSVIQKGATDQAENLEHQQERPKRMQWAQLPKRVFNIDIAQCPNCHGNLKIISAIQDPSVIKNILSHLGLPTRAPLITPVRPEYIF